MMDEPLHFYQIVNATFISRRAAFEGWDYTIRTEKPHWIHGGAAIASIQNAYTLGMVVRQKRCAVEGELRGQP